MSSEITTRNFVTDDYDAAVALWTKVEGVEIAEGDAREDIEGYLQRNPDLSRVAEAGSKLVGAVLCGHDGHRGHIYHLAVEPEYQRKGVGELLLNECLAGLRRVGLKRVIILVSRTNAAGRSFWLGRGWEDIDIAIPMGMDL
jgi:N-acetylglutamate synthase